MTDIKSADGRVCVCARVCMYVEPRVLRKDVWNLEICYNTMHLRAVRESVRDRSIRASPRRLGHRRNHGERDKPIFAYGQQQSSPAGTTFSLRDNNYL